TGAVRLTSSDTTVLTAGTSILARQLINAIKAGTATVTATYGGDDDNDEEGDTDPPERVSEPLTIVAVDGGLPEITLDPLNQIVEVPGTVTYSAEGRFTLGDGSTLEQPLTRELAWSIRTLDDKVPPLVGFTLANV